MVYFIDVNRIGRLNITFTSIEHYQPTIPAIIKSIAGSGSGNLPIGVGISISGSTALFNQPHGITYHSGLLYVADLGSSAFKAINLTNNFVTYISIGSGGPNAISTYQDNVYGITATNILYQLSPSISSIGSSKCHNFF